MNSPLFYGHRMVYGVGSVVPVDKIIVVSGVRLRVPLFKEGEGDVTEGTFEVDDKVALDLKSLLTNKYWGL